MNTQMYMMPNHNYLPREQNLYSPNDSRLFFGRPFGFGFGFGAPFFGPFGFGRPFFGPFGFGMPFGWGFGMPFFGGFPFFF